MKDAPEGIDPGLWERLCAEARLRARSAEPAHDFLHAERVISNAAAIARAEAASTEVLAASVTAALLHELYTVPKSDPRSPSAGDVCAEHARVLLAREGAPSDLARSVCDAIRDHAFSKGVVPEAPTSKILQDADRLDALGAIGLARMWATCADMKRPFYAPEDPFCESREPDDKLWGLDHVKKKLLAIPSRLHTDAARAFAAPRIAFLHAFADQLRRELGDP